jgi:arylsulfatase
MDRREFVKENAIIGASLYGTHLANAVSASASGDQSSSAERLPNVIFVTVDQQCADELGCMGNPEVKTPHLDRLAKEGVLFNNMFAQSGTCGPSRVAMLTGKYCHATGVQTNNAVLPPHEVNLPDLFGSKGYRCVAIGKVENIQGLPDGEIETDEGFLKGFHELHSQDKPDPNHAADSALNGYISTFVADPEEHWDVKTLRHAQRVLADHPEDPVFMWLSFHQPHNPMAPPRKFVDMYDPEKIKLPASATMEIVDRPGPVSKYADDRVTGKIDHDGIRRLRAVRYAAASFLDDCMGQLIDTVKSLGQERDTIVIYISDHGSYAGNFGWYRKFPFVLYDCLVHVPAIVWAPGRIDATPTVDALVESIDLPATLIDMFGIDRPWNMQGKSLIPLITGEESELHDAVFAETGFDLRCIMVRTTDWKFVYYHNGQPELYNLQTDPHETRNVYGKHPTVEARLRDRLLKWRMDTGSPLLKDHKRGRV